MVELTMNNLSETRQHIAQDLEKTKATDKEIARAKLLLEETFIRLKSGMGNLPDFSVKVELKTRFGEVDLRLATKGEEFNPIVTLAEQSNDDEDAYRLIILKAFRDKMTFVRKNGENIVTIKVHEASSSDKHACPRNYLWLGNAIRFGRRRDRNNQHGNYPSYSPYFFERIANDGCARYVSRNYFGHNQHDGRRRHWKSRLKVGFLVGFHAGCRDTV